MALEWNCEATKMVINAIISFLLKMKSRPNKINPIARAWRVAAIGIAKIKNGKEKARIPAGLPKRRANDLKPKKKIIEVIMFKLS